MDGNQVILSNYRDKEPVLLFFWTTWCPYCRIDLKTINAKYEELSRDGLKVLPINVGEPTNRVKNLLKNYNLVFKVLLDKDAKVAYAYGLSGVPTYVLIDKKGNIVSMGYQFPQKEYKAIISK
jgi:peroxiredoxin